MKGEGVGKLASARREGARGAERERSTCYHAIVFMVFSFCLAPLPSSLAPHSRLALCTQFAFANNYPNFPRPLAPATQATRQFAKECMNVNDVIGYCRYLKNKMLWNLFNGYPNEECNIFNNVKGYSYSYDSRSLNRAVIRQTSTLKAFG